MKTVRTKTEFMAALQRELERCEIADKNEIISDFERHFGESAKQGFSEAQVCEKLGDITDIVLQYAEEDRKETAARSFPDPTVSAAPEIPVPQTNGIPAKTDGLSTGPLVLDDFGDSKEIEELIKAAPAYPDAEDKSRQSETAKAQYSNSGNGENKTFVKTGTYGQNVFSSGNLQINIGGLITVLCVDFFILTWALPALFGLVISMLSIPLGLLGSGICFIIDGVLKAMNISAIFDFTSFGGHILGGISTAIFGVVLLCLGGLFTLLGIQLVKLCIKTTRGIINWHGKMIIGKTVFKNKNSFAG